MQEAFQTTHAALILIYVLSLLKNRLPSKDGLLDWDSFDSLNTDDMAKALAYIRENGTFPVSPTSLPFSSRILPILSAIILSRRTPLSMDFTLCQPVPAMSLTRSTASYMAIYPRNGDHSFRVPILRKSPG